MAQRAHPRHREERKGKHGLVSFRHGRPKRIHARHLNQEERIPIAGRPRPGDSSRAIARLPGRGSGAVGREVERNGNPGTGDCEPCRARQKAADRLKHPQTAQGGQGRKPRFREPVVMISERPPEIEDRAAPGRREGDLITGGRDKSAIGTLVERTTRFTILPHLPGGRDAGHVQRAIIDKMAPPPKLLRDSLTWDQGAEPAPHKRIGASPDMAVCFCDPHSPWQRGANENANGLLRQHFPKGTGPSVYPEDHLDAVAEGLNDRPRRTPGSMKPSEKIIELPDAA